MTIPPPEEAQALAERYAPAIYLHPEEKFTPLAPEAFIQRCNLVWRRNDGFGEVVQPQAQINLVDLGTGAYCHRLGSAGEGRPVSSAELTRPFTDDGRPSDVPASEGFALVSIDEYPGLAVDRNSMSQGVSTAPIYFQLGELDGTLLIAYWCFYGSSGVRTSALIHGGWRRARRSVPNYLRTLGLMSYVDISDLERWRRLGLIHQGDWEGITLALSADHKQVDLVEFRSHDGFVVVPMTGCKHEDPMTRRRVKVFSGLRSHASGYSSESREGELFSDHGARWDPVVTGHLIDVGATEWFGYGGAWGDPDLANRDPDNELFDRGDFGGPLGPPHKKLWGSPKSPSEILATLADTEDTSAGTERVGSP